MSKSKQIYQILINHQTNDDPYPNFPELIDELKTAGLNHKFQKTLQKNLVLSNLTYESFYNNLIFSALTNQDPKLAEQTKNIKETLTNELETLYTNQYPQSFSKHQLNNIHEPKNFWITCLDPFHPLILTYESLSMFFEK